MELVNSPTDFVDNAIFMGNLWMDMIIWMNENRGMCFACFMIVVELVFYLSIRFSYVGSVAKKAKPERLPENPEALLGVMMQTLYDLHHSGVYTWQQFISGWFCHAPCESVRKENMREFLAWCMYNKTNRQLTPGQRRTTSRMIGKFESKFSMKFKSGYNPSTKTIAFTHEPLEWFHRPLLVYLVSWGLRAVTDVIFILFGFRYQDQNGISYMYKKGPHKTRDLPVVFFHGLYTGTELCMPFLLRMCWNRSALLIRIPHINPSLTKVAPSRSEMMESFEQIIAKHKIARACFVGHSFGTCCVSWMAKHHPEIVAQAVFLDPVCFLLFLPDVAFNTLYRVPRSFSEWLVAVGVAKEPTVAHFLRRHFWWYQNFIQLDDLQCPSIAVLAELDQLAPVDAVHHYISTSRQNQLLEEAPATRGVTFPLEVKHHEVMWWPGFIHGSVLVEWAAQTTILKTMKKHQESFCCTKPVKQVHKPVVTPAPYQ
mmetsp:Transcript_2165/g.3193  ORF Transcript_2165/g.3193 Transcript_2165/m.3193 type:complete len:483 (-) Transcript_2165:147-1595(-)|eukprot:CAMPEP_0113943924 /NCGR_PEP_ID=MMETSP1339-20121228/29591_1 /TAXON_ID=94617 /ORGANISM="Fibrocapsa japonica" /LENGTH=482 /DNA_ID=CAMNT_0000948929 /DNA_START=118 /DNA_END=1566 /DNA_ORIENTATION=- /assembly_acc=CAM_ASM_000762